MRNRLQHICFTCIGIVSLCIFVSGALCSEEEFSSQFVLEVDDMASRAEYEATKEPVESYMVTKEIEGTIKAVDTNEVTVTTEQQVDVKLYIDAETIIYINDERQPVRALQQGDDLFAYYIEENGIYNCDWIEVVRAKGK